jgi:hypothetical protein
VPCRIFSVARKSLVLTASSADHPDRARPDRVQQSHSVTQLLGAGQLRTTDDRLWADSGDRKERRRRPASADLPELRVPAMG